MSEDTEKKEWPEVYDERMIKILSLVSGEKIITYVKELGEYGQYICERPFTVCCDTDEGEYFLTTYCPYADPKAPIVFQQAGVIGVANTTEESRAQYLSCIRDYIMEHEDFGGMMAEAKEQLYGIKEPGVFESSYDIDTKDLYDLTNWIPNTKPN